MLSSIRKHGLGGENVVRSWRAADFLKAAWQACLSHSNSSELAVYQLLVDRMLENWDAKQSITESNWRHGNVYLTSDPRRAAMYSRYGGPELVGFGFEMLGDVIGESSLMENAILRDFQEIAEWRNTGSKSLVLKVRALDPALLRTETGHELEETEELTDFEYLGVLPFDRCLTLLDCN